MNMNELEDALMVLVEKGLVNVTYNEDLEAMFQITPEGVEAYESFKEALN
jgi:predicted transcriptional regulator